MKDEIERRVATREDVLRARAIMQAALNTAVDYYPEGVEQWMQNWISVSNRVYGEVENRSDAEETAQWAPLVEGVRRVQM